MLAEITGGFRLLATELTQAVLEAQSLLKTPNPILSRNLGHRAAYITTQVALLQNQTLELAISRTPDQSESRFLMGLSSIASRLERISDMLLNLDRQAGFLSDPAILNDFNLDEFFQEILFGLEKILPALDQKEVGLALRLGQAEEKLDACYADRFARLISEFNDQSRTGDMVTILMIIHYLERIGDILLEIGEKIIYVILGEKMKLAQYQALGVGLKTAGLSLKMDRLDFHSIWGGRSGCRIGVVGSPEAGAGETVLFKHGPGYKLTREKENLELWSGLRPGLTPKVRAFIPARDSTEAALMLEFIPSRNLQALFMENAETQAMTGLGLALKIMAGLWQDTRQPTPCRAEFTRQAESRLSEVATLYPSLISQWGLIGRLQIKTISQLINLVTELERDLSAPFTTRIHGDFNLSNLLYNPENNALNVIDLYRSRTSDYVQDVSVMLISIIRLPLFNSPSRYRLTRAALLAFDFTKNFANEMKDDTYEARLAFGLARSFFTSTRFELHESMASQFVARARYLWEKLLEHGRTKKNWSEFRFSKNILELNYVDKPRHL